MKLNNQKEKIHPLLNKESKHYELIGGLQAIELLEGVMSLEELKSWAKGNYLKYQLRLGSKDNVQKELKKMATYKDYYDYLVEKDEQQKSTLVGVAS